MFFMRFQMCYNNIHKAVGDIFITGIVGSCSSYDPLMLQSVRLSVVMRMADCISRSIGIVEKLWDNAALV